jgi:hypothetical protein
VNFNGRFHETTDIERQSLRTEGRHFARRPRRRLCQRGRDGAAPRRHNRRRGRPRRAGGHVVRTRILLTRIEDWQAVAAVHGEFFREIRPVNTIMQVTRFIDPDWLVEIEADAVVDD